MKRLLSILLVIVLLFAVPITSGEAAGNAELGELEIASEKVQGNVGDLVKVNFYLYPNLPDDRKLDTVSGSMKFDPEFVTLGAINLEDEEANLTTFMKVGKRTVYDFQHNIIEPGVMRFAFMSVYGAEAEGFWFQAEFRIEKEGSTDFIFNGISYSGIDGSYKGVSFYIEPKSVGGIYTEGETPPENGEVDEPFMPIEPAVKTPVPVTPTPKPSNSGHTVPITSSLPTINTEPADDHTGVVTLPPAVTSIPLTTPVPPDSTERTSAPGQTTDAPNDPAAKAEPASGTQKPGTNGNESTGITDEPGNSGTSGDSANTGKEPKNGTRENKQNTLIVIGVIIGIVSVIGLGALAIAMLVKRRKSED